MKRTGGGGVNMQQPKSGLALVHDPDDAFEHARFLREVAQQDPRRLFVPVSPGADNIRIVGNDILKALGKDSDLLGSGRSGRDTWLRALLWLQLSEVEELYISRAHLLSPWLLEQLISAVCLSGARLVLIFQIAALRANQQCFLAAWPLQQMTVKELTAATKVSTRPRRRDQATTQTERRLAGVPIDDFTSFRASARQMLGDEDFAAVDAEFLAAFSKTSTYLRESQHLSEDIICEHVRDLIADSDWMPQILTRVRGSQVAAFHAGYLMKVNLDVLSATRTPRVHLDTSSLSILKRFDTPRLTAAAVLTLATQLPLDEILTVNMQDVADDGRRITINERVHVLEPQAAAMIEVLVRERLSYFADDSDPLFGYIKGTGRRADTLERWTSRGMYDALKRIERETSLMLTTHLLDAGQRDAVSWARRRGISLQRI